MNSCVEYADRAFRFLDGNLQRWELEDFHSHLNSCVSCQLYLEEEKALSEVLRRARPLYTAPTALRARIATAAMQASTSASDKASRFPPRIFGGPAGVSLRFPRMRLLALAALAAALCLAFVPNIVRNARATTYVETAVTKHQNYVNGTLPIEFRSSTPELVAAWFAGKVPFQFQLPAGESAPQNKPSYWLSGAAVVNYNGSPAALVLYETQNDKITLLADSSSSAVVAGGDTVRFGKLTFHYRNQSGFRVITWNNHGLSYALVSSISGPARVSCLVCHQSMTDSNNFTTRP